MQFNLYKPPDSDPSELFKSSQFNHTVYLKVWCYSRLFWFVSTVHVCLFFYIAIHVHSIKLLHNVWVRTWDISTSNQCYNFQGILGASLSSWLYCENSYICSSAIGVSALLVCTAHITRRHCSKFSITPLSILMSQNSITVFLMHTGASVCKLQACSYTVSVGWICLYHVSAHSPICTCLRQ